ncbi:hypothetical protein GCM10018787_05620 [Streptomyces thermodiastaticus]|nr:hypothetical protein GCM10018787_05620 [Streptomyces thermodiastaticus]
MGAAQVVDRGEPGHPGGREALPGLGGVHPCHVLLLSCCDLLTACGQPLRTVRSGLPPCASARVPRARPAASRSGFRVPPQLWSGHPHRRAAVTARGAGRAPT